MAEPSSPLVELVGRWRPIFADPERDYHYLTSIRCLRRTRRGARFALAVDDGSTLNLVVTFVWGDSILPLAPAMDYVGQKPWEPLGLDVRVNSEAEFSFPDPERTVEVRAERNDGEVLLTMSGAGRAFEVRFLPPGRLRDVRFSGRASETGWEEMDSTTIVRLRASGPCTLEAKCDGSTGVD
jgi:hypothetical protein